jgi:hypothetical protein
LPSAKCLIIQRYFTSTTAPASVNFFLMVSASSLETPSFTGLGAPSTKSLASFKPRLVTSRTALMTLILLAPTSLRTTVNSVCASAAGAAAVLPRPATTALRSVLPTAASPPFQFSSILDSFSQRRSFAAPPSFVIRKPGFQCALVLYPRQTTR